MSFHLLRGSEPDEVTSCYAIPQDGGAYRLIVGQIMVCILKAGFIGVFVCTVKFLYEQQYYTRFSYCGILHLHTKAAKFSTMTGQHSSVDQGNIYKFVISDGVTPYLLSVFRRWRRLKTGQIDRLLQCLLTRQYFFHVC